MDVMILNTDLDAVSIVDTYESFIWTDRYYAYGDFELYEAMRDGLLDYIKQDYYLQSKESEHVMIVEKIQITSDTEDGNHVTVTGRSLESILDRRIVWGQKLLSGNLQNGIKTYIRDRKVAINALKKANHKCEVDSEHEVFLRRNVEVGYTESHHLVPMAYSDIFDVSLDVEENIVSLCSHCHNLLHYGKEFERVLEQLYYERVNHLNKVGIYISFDQLREMYL